MQHEKSLFGICGANYWFGRTPHVKTWASQPTWARGCLQDAAAALLLQEAGGSIGANVGSKREGGCRIEPVLATP